MDTTINRTVVVVMGKNPFYDWGNEIFPDMSPMTEENVVEHNAYLIDEDRYVDDAKEALRGYWKTIFEDMLFGICTDESTWPALTWKRFEEWFDCHFSTVVNDLSDQPLIQETYE